FLTGARVVVSLAVVLGLLWMLQRRLTRGSRKGAAGHPVTIVTKQAISPKASVVIIDVDGTRLLLGVTEHAVSVLQTGETPEPVFEEAPAIAGPSAAKAFASSLSKVTTAKLAGQKATTTKAATSRDGTELAAFAAQGPLAGSILSPGTWKQLATTLRQGR
ncbi:MAG: flagellar biosynthetic protein FliO, partial [Lacisediminihabitans sp.]